MANMTNKPKTKNESPDSHETLTLKDGRNLAYARYGAKTTPNTIPIFYFNGTPSSRLECLLIDEPARRLGIPLIATDRPGFGQSSYQQDRTLLQWPRDVLQLADHLGIAQFGIIGLSGGGPHALACLHQIPKARLVAVTVVSGMYPTEFGMKGMMWPTWLLFATARYSTWVVEMLFEAFVGRMARGVDERALAEHMKSTGAGSPQPEVDKECIREMLEDDVLKRALVAAPKEALRSSSKGAAWEVYMLGSNWGFRIEDLDPGRLTMWHGSLDANVPLAMSKKASELLPDAKYRTVDGEGHMSLIVRHRHDILSELMQRL